MSARRCSRCAISYPNLVRHSKCHGCEAETSVMNDEKPQDDWKQRAWESYYRIHDAARQGPDPDELGRREARKLIEMERALKEAE